MDYQKIVRVNLRLKKPVTIRLIIRKDRSGAVADYRPSYNAECKLRGHLIRVYMQTIHDFPGRHIPQLIIHELIHAKQEESGGDDRDHGKKFRRIARRLSALYNLPGIYVPGLDYP